MPDFQHEAIYELYKNVEQISGMGTSVIATDKSGNVVSLDATAVATKQKELEEAHDILLLRLERDKLLAETDYWIFSDTATATQAQLDYRQALRDITKTYKSMDDAGFSWPTKPS